MENMIFTNLMELLKMAVDVKTLNFAYNEIQNNLSKINLNEYSILLSYYNDICKIIYK